MDITLAFYVGNNLGTKITNHWQPAWQII